MPMKKQTSKWFLVFTKTKEEQRAKTNLENQGFQMVFNDLHDSQTANIIFTSQFFHY